MFTTLKWTLQRSNEMYVATGQSLRYRMAYGTQTQTWTVEARDSEGKCVLTSQSYRRAWAEEIANIHEAKSRTEIPAAA